MSADSSTTSISSDVNFVWPFKEECIEELKKYSNLVFKHLTQIRKKLVDANQRYDKFFTTLPYYIFISEPEDEAYVNAIKRKIALWNQDYQDIIFRASILAQKLDEIQTFYAFRSFAPFLVDVVKEAKSLYDTVHNSMVTFTLDYDGLILLYEDLESRALKMY